MRSIILILCLFLTSQVYALSYGIDRLHENEIVLKLQGKKLAVLTHAAGADKNGTHLIDLLFQNFSLKKIFAPEHGLRSLNDDWVGDGIDEATGLPVISLYKQGGRIPRVEDLMGLDAVVVDLQDVGVRYYTYFSTIAGLIKVAAPLKIEIIILDRPNLLGGNIVEGKTLDESLAGSFTGYHTIPTRHGMTLGELALMLNAEKKIGAELTIVPVKGWQRENLLNVFDRPWIPPSPALLERKQVGLYALWGALENFNLTVGRGKTNELAFQVLGAPWITKLEAEQLAQQLNQLHFSHLTFSAKTWTVTRDLYNGKLVNGVQINWDGEEVRTDELTYKVAALLVNTFKARLTPMSPLGYGSQSMIEAIKNNFPWENFSSVINFEIESFKVRREPYLLY